MIDTFVLLNYNKIQNTEYGIQICFLERNDKMIISEKSQKQILTKIDQWLDDNTPSMVNDILRLVRIRSISDASQGFKGAPYGQECLDALNTVMDYCNKLGLPTVNHEGYCATAVLKGNLNDEIGIFSHLDIVPAGNGWSFDPFDPFVRDGFIFGRGTLDNKGAVVTTIYTVKCLLDLGYHLDHSILLFFGCNEEKGMEDVKYYLSKNKAPIFSFTADSDFPLANAEYGIYRAVLRKNIGDSNLEDLYAGEAENMVPDKAWAIFSNLNFEELQSFCKNSEAIQIVALPDGLVKIIGSGIASHAAFPQKSKNALVTLADFILSHKLALGSAEETFRFLANSYRDCYGIGLNLTSAPSDRLFHIGSCARLKDNMLSQTIDIRYAPEISSENISEKLNAHCEKYHFSVGQIDVNPPMYISPDHPAVKALTSISNQILKTNNPPHIAPGGTYARKIPNCVGFGPNISHDTNPFCPGKGSGHQPDEVTRIYNLQNALKIYVLGLLEIDHLL